MRRRAFYRILMMKAMIKLQTSHFHRSKTSKQSNRNSIKWTPILLTMETCTSRNEGVPSKQIYWVLENSSSVYCRLFLAALLPKSFTINSFKGSAQAVSSRPWINQLSSFWSTIGKRDRIMRLNCSKKINRITSSSALAIRLFVTDVSLRIQRLSGKILLKNAMSSQKMKMFFVKYLVACPPLEN